MSTASVPRLPEYNEAAADERALLIGIRKEKACAPVVNSGLFTAMLEAGDVLFIDEIHRLSPVVEEYLYSAMEDYRIDIMIDKGPSIRASSG